MYNTYMIKEYIAYIKDNPQGYWFKRKLYGWGWTPATWQGWLITLVFIGAIVYDTVSFETLTNPTNDAIISFLLEIVALIAVFIAICWKKGEEPRWQWGLKKKDDTK